MITINALLANRSQTHRPLFAYMALLVALHCSPALAVEVDDAAKSNLASSSQADVSWLSGGVGDEAMSEMRKQAKAYNVHVLMTGPRGHYLAGIPFRVSRRSGQVWVSGVTEGPLLYLKLPPGGYQMAAEIYGAWQTRRIQVSDKGTATMLRFIARGE